MKTLRVLRRAFTLYAHAVTAFRRAGATWREALLFPLALAPISGGSTWISDLANNVVAGMGLRIAAYTSTQQGTAVDLVDAEGTCFCIVLPGVVTDGTFAWKVRECATSGGSYADCATQDTVGAIASNTPQVINFKRTMRFIKVQMTVSGSPSTGAIVGALVLGMKKAT